ncbi:EamA family transporter [Nocardioides marmoribigeumensis]|jgi:drug/metabolite transporter (DMT)-like permease|uniref:Drug/metabolite transporter (DMT)-like permease n=1 Tax=Nocardioides marmoribigeumensis TaxID=433649 RepID=A0ABU2BRF1_9ACTN|nr:EamA family transporter [Nocardioides marmoribigeumensis]MDR7361188.1 drug/metabolite transporter (DMT)-like permease [Nocardioides marmoribigeumensis]
MTTVLLALASAAAYGASDFVGGVVSRRTPAWGVAFAVQLTSALAVLGVALARPHGLTTPDLLWGLMGGVGSGVGIAFLFRGFAAGRMSVVAPLSAVGAAVVPVAVGLLTGERPGPLVLAGLAVAVPGIWLVSVGERAPGEVGADAPRSASDSGILDGVLAGLGFSATFIGLGRLGDDPGLWPLVASQTMSAVTVVVLATALGSRLFPLDRAAWRAWPGGPLGSLALVLYQASTAAGLLTVAVVVTSLYPAMTILLAVLLLKEHISRPQTLGLILCGVCVALVAAG